MMTMIKQSKRKYEYRYNSSNGFARSPVTHSYSCRGILALSRQPGSSWGKLTGALRLVGDAREDAKDVDGRYQWRGMHGI